MLCIALIYWLLAWFLCRFLFLFFFRHLPNFWVFVSCSLITTATTASNLFPIIFLIYLNDCTYPSVEVTAAFSSRRLPHLISSTLYSSSWASVQLSEFSYHRSRHFRRACRHFRLATSLFRRVSLPTELIISTLQHLRTSTCTSAKYKHYTNNR